ncbi:MAG: hypothetical protein AAGF32_07965 [Pseudomonadota bacterium]
MALLAAGALTGCALEPLDVPTAGVADAGLANAPNPAEALADGQARVEGTADNGATAAGTGQSGALASATAGTAPGSRRSARWTGSTAPQPALRAPSTRRQPATLPPGSIIHSQLRLSFAPQMIEPRRKEFQAFRNLRQELDDNRIVEIAIARGGHGNAFQQALLTHSRAQTLRQALPEGTPVRVRYDPSLPDNTAVVVVRTRNQS